MKYPQTKFKYNVAARIYIPGKPKNSSKKYNAFDTRMPKGRMDFESRVPRGCEERWTPKTGTVSAHFGKFARRKRTRFAFVRPPS